LSPHDDDIASGAELNVESAPSDSTFVPSASETILEEQRLSCRAMRIVSEVSRSLDGQEIGR
jgi:hypothetical protein